MLQIHLQITPLMQQIKASAVVVGHKQGSMPLH